MDALPALIFQRSAVIIAVGRKDASLRHYAGTLRRVLNGFDIGAVFKGMEHRLLNGQRDGFQAGTVVECTRTDGSNIVGNNKGLKACASIKPVGADAGAAEGDVFQRTAPCKGKVPLHGNAGRNMDGSQAAAGKGVSADFLQRFRKRDGRQSSTIEGIIVNAHKRGGQADFCKPPLALVIVGVIGNLRYALTVEDFLNALPALIFQRSAVIIAVG